MTYEQAASNVPQQPTRISAQIEQLRVLADRIDSLTQRNVKHARQLGFFEPPSGSALGQVAPTPVLTSVDDMINQLQRSVDNLDGSMNLFN